MKKLIFYFVVCLTTTICSQELTFGKVSKAELEEQFYPLDSTVSAAYLYRYRNTYYDYEVDDGFRVITEVHNRVKIYSKEGFDKGIQKIVYYSPKSGSQEKVTGLKAYTFNLQKGKVIKSKVAKKEIFDERINNYYQAKKIAMPNIQQYAIVDIKYKIISPYRGIDDLKFQFDIPVKKLEYKTGIPSYFKFREYVKGYYQIKPQIKFKNRNIEIETADKMVSQVGGYVKKKGEVFKLNVSIKESLFLDENIPALKGGEVFVGNIDNYRGSLIYELASITMPESMPEYFTTSWEDVNKKIYNSGNFGEELEKKSYYSKDLSSLIKDAQSEAEKVALIFQYVKSKIKWNRYYSKFTNKGVRKAYKDGSGNSAEINLILTSMLRSAEINANPVLVSTKSNGIPLFPTIKGYNYVLTKVNFLDGKYMLLDATELYSMPNVLPSRVINWKGKEISKKGNMSDVSLYPLQYATKDNILNIKITDDLEVKGMIRSKYSNHSALDFRNQNNHLKDESIIASLEEIYPIEIENFRISNRLKLSKPIGVLIKFSSSDLIEEINGNVYIDPLLFFTRKSNPFKLNERKFPIDFNTPWKNKYSINIQIPEGYKIESVPKALAIALPDNMGVFKFLVKGEANKIRVTSILQFKDSFISPEYYQDVKSFFKKIVEKQTEKIVLIKK